MALTVLRSSIVLNLSGKRDEKFTKNIEANVLKRHVANTSQVNRIKAPDLGSTLGGVKIRI